MIAEDKPTPQTQEREVKDMLIEAVPMAVQALIDIIADSEAAPNLRIKCAETVLERVYGKSGQLLETSTPPQIEVVMAKNLKNLAK
ncbi:MAG: hypothetical protein IKV41_00015 [Oscillospiraceae bacterium]|nr:hypothetical protein [Oscillospiraceae bacterium]